MHLQGSMDELSSYYSELSLLQLKYEHLAETSRTLLKPWPRKKSSKFTTVGEESKSSQTSQSSAKSPTPELSPNREAEQIDALLDKAQKMRIGGGEIKRSKQSFQLAASVYSNGDKSAKILKAGISRTRQSKLQPEASSIIGSSRSGRRQIKANQRQASHVSELADGPSGRVGTATSSLRSQRKSRDLETEQPPQVFCLERDGAQLSMPSEYRKLQRTITRCYKVLDEDLTSKAAAIHYSKRLFSKQSAACSDHINLLLAAEEIGLLKAKLTSMTPFEWTVSNRSDWEDVLLVKTKCDLLMECYYRVLTRDDRHKDDTFTSGQKHAGNGHQQTAELGYSSVKDWNALAAMEMQKRFSEWEVKYLEHIQKRVLPMLTRHVQEPALDEQAGAATATMLRMACLVSNIPTKPIYLDTKQYH